MDGYFRGGSTAAYDLQEPDMVLAILGFTNLSDLEPFPTRAGRTRGSI